MPATKHTLVALVEDKPGVLNRIASLFRRRGFNIESIAVGSSEIPHLSRMTIVVDGATTMVEQVRKQVDKIVDVVKVSDISSEDIVARELALIKVKATSSTRSEIIQIAQSIGALGDGDRPFGIGPQRNAGDAQIGGLFLNAAGIRQCKAAVENQVHEAHIVERI